MVGDFEASTESLLIRDPAFKLLKGKSSPEFMLIGAAKSGTTSFSYYLPRHPQVQGCTPKEPNFWSWQMCNREQYQSLFVNGPPLTDVGPGQRIGGEYSTSYLLHPLAPRRIKARLPGLKILILLRNPVDRAYSHYVMAHRNSGADHCSFDAVIARELEEVEMLLPAHRRGFEDDNYRTQAHRSDAQGYPLEVKAQDTAGTHYRLDSEQALLRYYSTSCLFRSIYDDQVARWQALFSGSQIKILDSARLLHDRNDLMREATRFLGLTNYDFSAGDLGATWGGGANDHNTPGDYAPLPASTRQQLQDYFAPYNERLFELIGQRFDW